MEKLVLGVDYGTDSARAVLINSATGKALSTGTSFYPRWQKGLYCDPSIQQYRQHPLDYIESLEQSVKEALANAPEGSAQKVVGLGVDMTGSTPGIVDVKGQPLALHPDFSEDPDAMFVLWKDHTAVEEAELINTTSRQSEVDYTKFSGGTYSSEWFWSKMLHVVRKNKKVRASAFSFMECSDWLPALLTGVSDVHEVKRNRCAAGHKAMWHKEWGGLPPKEFWKQVDPVIVPFCDNLYTETITSDKSVGTLCPEWAQRLGLPETVTISAGILDAHAGAVGGGITPGTLLKVIGTSTCDMMVADYSQVQGRCISGICGQVDGSIIPNMVGFEAGQSAFGDLYAWLRELLLWPVKQFAPEKLADAEREMLAKLTLEAEKISVSKSLPVAIDWFNGRRTPDADQRLKGVIANLTLDTNAAQIFKALVEATAYGARAIVERFESEGVTIKAIAAVGGVAKKSPFVMQTLADVLNRPVQVAESDQACALGAAIFASVAAGIYPDTLTAQEMLGTEIAHSYHPSNKAVLYNELYQDYLTLGKTADILKQHGEQTK